MMSFVAEFRANSVRSTTPPRSFPQHKRVYARLRRAMRESSWVPAFAGTSGRGASSLTLAGMICAALFAHPAAAAEKVTYLLPAPPSLPAFAPWVLAKHLGYYTEAGYEVDFVVARGGVDVAKQIGVGNAPIGGAIGDTPIIVRGNGVPVKAVGLMGGGALTIVVGRKDRGIERLEDLRGKKISVLAFQDTTYYALLGALASKNITKNDVNAQAVGPAAVASLVVAGTVDACACTPDWEIDVREGVKDTVSLPTKDYFQSMAQAILASDKMIAERPDMVRAIVKATLRGMQFVMNDPAKAALVYVEAAPSFKGKEELMKKILANYTERTYKGQATLGAMDPQRLANLQRFYKQQGFIEAELPVDQLYSNEFIK
jgi:NitT/TauT family transport system substrate-binding protein